MCGGFKCAGGGGGGGVSLILRPVSALGVLHHLAARARKGLEVCLL